MTAQIENTIKNLTANGMEVHFVEDRASALAKVEELLPEGCTVAVGGSDTLVTTGVLGLLRSGKYNFLDRYEAGLSSDEVGKIFRDSFFVDYYFSSSNAITEKGELYNVDGNCNRISAIAFGPKNVIIVAGVNKIVPDLPAAVLRVKTVAAPKNCKRLGINSYCSKTGYCISIDRGEGEIMGAGCNTDARICCNTLVSAKQRTKDRIKVILVNEKLGY